MDDNMDTMAFYDMEDYDDQLIQQNREYEYEFEGEEKETLSELYHYCLSPTLYDTFQYMIPLLSASLVFKVFAQSQYTTYKIFHGLSTVIGIYIIQHYVPECLHLLVALVASSYAVLCLPKEYHRGIGIILSCFSIILYCEWWMKPADWHKVRSVIMIAVMKVVSIGVDKMESDSVPGPLEYSGYMLCPATGIFGPWVSYKDYAALYRRNHWSVWWALTTVGYLLLAYFFLSISNCWAQWILSDTAWKWAVAYREALAFRASHYFVSYASASTLLLGGYPVSLATVTKPTQIELPHSLVQVVIYWNIPMHSWLKAYVFRHSSRKIGKFGAVIVTYLTSALLHGLNFQLAAVLFSLGLYTYVEYQLRSVLAYVFDACIASKQCVDHKCSHKRTARNCWWVVATNLAFSGLAVFHLAYLGVMFDTSELQETGYSYAHTIDKWSHLSFASHWVACATYFVYFLVT